MLFRLLMGVGSDNYQSFKELKRDVITPAVREINQKSDIAIQVEYKKIGHKIVSIKFLIYENENYKPQFKRTNKKRPVEISNNEMSINNILQDEFHMGENQIAQIANQYALPYILEKISIVRSQKKVNNKIAYLISALKNDYQLEGEGRAVVPEINMAKTNAILQERREASEFFSLHKKYMQYKAEIYIQWINDPIHYEIYHKFADYLRDRNPMIFDNFKKIKFESPLIVSELIDFLETNYTNFLPHCLSVDEFLTSEI